MRMKRKSIDKERKMKRKGEIGGMKMRTRVNP